ncbi:hypothetical protein Scep_008521 [Stephania cephalantha]|uniref:ABC transporter domain-containing protein n=1 Tax=Stephania cephalantha TaxID=152367 RepID=A0AAP0KDU4_9MAGN
MLSLLGIKQPILRNPRFPDVRLFRQYLVLLLTNQVALGLCRFIAGLRRNIILLILIALGGFLLSRGIFVNEIDDLLSYSLGVFCFATSINCVNASLTAAENMNKWSICVLPNSTEPLGVLVLKSRAIKQLQHMGMLKQFLKRHGSACYYSSEGQADDIRTDVSSKYVSNRADEHVKKGRRGMVLLFQPLSITFNEITYSVDIPQEMKNQGITEDRLELLKGVSGAFKPGVLTALMGVRGAGKTTLMDVLAGRKTGGTLTEASPFPATLKSKKHLPEVDATTRKMFIEEVMELVELTPLRGALVGLPCVDGLSTEQRKRLTVVVEHVANPSIIFMDEPTPGLDARAAAIVMRQELKELAKLKMAINPASWMLETTTAAQEDILGIGFAEVYKNSNLYRRHKALIQELGTPPPGSKDLHFSTKYSQSFFTQCKACLWKQYWSYWRNPPYNALRFFFTVLIALMFGTIFWYLGSRANSEQDLFNSFDSIYAALIFIRVQNTMFHTPQNEDPCMVDLVLLEFPSFLVPIRIGGVPIRRLGEQSQRQRHGKRL